MDTKRAHRVLQEVARNNGNTVEEVIRDIEMGIKETIDEAIKENNTVVLNKWKKIPCIGSQPTAVELVAYLGERMINDKVDDCLSGNFCSPNLFS